MSPLCERGQGYTGDRQIAHWVGPHPYLRPDGPVTPGLTPLLTIGGGRMVHMPNDRDLRHAAVALRRIVELTSGLPEDSQADAAFRERLELVAEVLEAAANPK
jgi:hypothetical protein